MLANRIMSDDLWEVVEPLLPAPPPPRRQGGGRHRTDNRTTFVAIAYMVTTDTPWREMPRWLTGVAHQTAYRRYRQWTAAGLWEALHDAGTALPSTWLCDIAAAAQHRTTIEPGPRPVEPEPTVEPAGPLLIVPTIVDVIRAHTV